MTDTGQALLVRLADHHDSLDDLIEGAYARAIMARGGVAFLEQLWGREIGLDEVRASVQRCVLAGDVWVALDEGQVVAGALIREKCVQAIWVLPGHRRRGAASSVLQRVLNSNEAPVDAWALPGDRATKSLYESVGWKARLLTMRGA